MLYRILLKVWLLPPTINLLAIVAGLLLLRRMRRLGIALIVLGAGSLWLLSTTWVANSLLLGLQQSWSATPEAMPSLEPSAIVVLGSANRNYSPEYREVQPDTAAVARLNYAAYLHDRTGLPVLLAGGVGYGGGGPHSEVMANYLHKRLHVEPRWLDTQSRTTEENARYSRELLAAEGIERVVLVTQSFHMRRAKLLFEAQGFEVLPAPTQLADPRLPAGEWVYWLPEAEALLLSRAVVHEYLGLAWYKLVPPE